MLNMNTCTSSQARILSRLQNFRIVQDGLGAKGPWGPKVPPRAQQPKGVDMGARGPKWGLCPRSGPEAYLGMVHLRQQCGFFDLREDVWFWSQDETLGLDSRQDLGLDADATCFVWN